MNERIQQLYDTALVAAGKEKQFETTHLDVAEKFAELIVAECIGIVDDAERGGGNEVWDNAVKFIRRDLKQHFGVER